MIKDMIAEAREARAEIVALALIVVLGLASVLWFNAQRDAFPQEKYNVAYVWCESQSDVESCRWGAFVALSPALNK